MTRMLVPVVLLAVATAVAAAAPQRAKPVDLEQGLDALLLDLEGLHPDACAELRARDSGAAYQDDTGLVLTP